MRRFFVSRGRFFLRSSLIVLSTVCVVASVAAQTYITNPNQVPLWHQHHDYRATYNGRDSAIPVNPNTLPNGPFVSYDNLPATAGVNVNGPRYQTGGQGAQFGANDYYNANHNAGNDLAGGSWHCAPASTGMWFEWLTSNVLTSLPNRGGEVASISGFAQDADTNQQRVSTGTGIGLFGTFRPQMVTAADNFVGQTYTRFLGFGPYIRSWNYTEAAYRQMIDRGKPPVVFYQNVGQNSGHVVVGVGYDGTTGDALLRDPWTGTERRKAFNTISQLGGGGGNVAYGAEPPSSSFNADWAGARLMEMEVTHTGNAPSLYYFNHPTNDISSLREWLGPSVAPDSDPINGSPASNADGVQLNSFLPGGLANVTVTVSSISGLSLDPLLHQDMPPILNLAAWIDWNQDNVWDPTEQILQWSGAADFDGSQILHFSFNVPQGATGQYWAHFRLNRGETSAPYGLIQFGETEDYLFAPLQGAPEPSAGILVLLGAVGFAVRKRGHGT